MQTQTESGNRLIAEFMGLKCIKDTEEPGDNWEWLPTPKHSNWCSKSAPPYSNSWNWLMPVIEKIESLTNQVGVRFQISINSKYVWNTKANNNDFIYSCGIVQNQHRIIYEMGYTKLEATYTAVLAFIEFYNQSINNHE